MLDRNDVNSKVRSRADYWQAMVLNGYYMPQERCAINTIKWMEGIRQGMYWLPKRKEMQLGFQLPRSPTKKQLVAILSEVADLYVQLEENVPIANQILRTIDLVVDKPPNIEWIVNMIGHLEPENEIFQKNYVPPAKVIAQRPSLQYKFDNEDGFFDDLPQLPGNRMNGRALAVPKIAQMQFKLRRLQEMQQALQQQIFRQQTSIAEEQEKHEEQKQLQRQPPERVRREPPMAIRDPQNMNRGANWDMEALRRALDQRQIIDQQQQSALQSHFSEPNVIRDQSSVSSEDSNIGYRNPEVYKSARDRQMQGSASAEISMFAALEQPAHMQSPEPQLHPQVMGFGQRAEPPNNSGFPSQVKKSMAQQIQEKHRKKQELLRQAQQSLQPQNFNHNSNHRKKTPKKKRRISDVSSVKEMS